MVVIGFLKALAYVPREQTSVDPRSCGQQQLLRPLLYFVLFNWRVITGELVAEQAKLIIALTVLCLTGGMQLGLLRTWGPRESILEGY